MAIVPYAADSIGTRGDNAHIISWEGLGVGDDGQPVEMPGSERRSVQAIGTFGGGKCHIEGSNNGTNYETLFDEFGNNLKFNGPGISTVSGVTRFIRPNIIGGGVTTNISVFLLIRKEGRK